MPETPPRYRAILTDAGAELEARALAESKGIVLTHIAVGDANNEYIAPSSDATKLVHEVWRNIIERKTVSPDDPNITLLHTMIPAKAGGFWIREVGVFGHLDSGKDKEADILYVYANHAPYYKMLPVDGQAVTHELTIPVIQSSNAEISIEVADKGYITRGEFYDYDNEHKILLASIFTTLIQTLDSQTREALKGIELENSLLACQSLQAIQAQQLINSMDRITRLEMAFYSCGFSAP